MTVIGSRGAPSRWIDSKADENPMTERMTVGAAVRLGPYRSTRRGCPARRGFSAAVPVCSFQRCVSLVAVRAASAALDVALGAADDLDHRLARIRALERALQVAGDAEPGERQRLFDAFARRAGGSGMRAVELVGESAELVERASGILERPRPPQPLLHDRPVAP